MVEFLNDNLVRILKGSNIAEIDKKCIESGIDSKWLMNNAGTGVSDFIEEIFKSRIRFKETDYSFKDFNGVVLCGTGNNGGDGFVCAYNLSKLGFKINTYCIGLKEKLSNDSLFYFNKLSELLNVNFISSSDLSYLSKLKDDLEKCDFVVDAIFGTGLHGSEIRGFALEIIKLVNASKRVKYEIYSNVIINNEYRKTKDETIEERKGFTVFAVDIPSGVDSDDGKVLGEAIKADYTITFGAKKLGLLMYPGAEYCGKVVVVDIGIPSEYYSEYENFFESTLKWVSDSIPYRPATAYKHSVGKLLVIAGSKGFTGAAAMTCMAAMRAGAGLVTLVCPRELNDIFEIKLTEVMTLPVNQTESCSISYDSFDKIFKESKKYDAIAIGPGLSRHPSTIQLVREVLKNIKKPTVLDADGLQALKEWVNDDLFDLNHIVITPHSGELASILGIEKIQPEDRINVNIQTAKKFNLVSLLKGPSTVISNKEGITFLNPTGDFALATAGTGDILTGIIGSFLCQGMSQFTSAICGAYVHGLSSDIISKNTSKTSLVATDLLDGLKQVFTKIEKLKY